MRKMNKLLAMLLALVMVLQMVPFIGVAAADNAADTFARPSVAVYPFPARIYNNHTKHFDTTTTPGVYVFDSANVTDGSDAALISGVGDDATITHTKDLVLIQTVCIEAMPEGSAGLKINLSDRHKNEDGSNAPGGDLLLADVYNEGGNLKLLLAETYVIDLGVKLGEEFELALDWNADNSGAVYVNGICKGAYDNVNISRDYSAGNNLSYTYATPTDGAKFYLTNAAVYESAKNAVAAAFQALIAELKLDAVFGNANLPAKVSCADGEAAIIWTSSNTAVLSNDGKVVALPNKDTKVTLTATAAGQSASVVATVKANDYIAPTVALYSLPAMIQTNMVSNVDYTTNEGQYVITGNGYMYGKPHTNVFDHIANDILLKQTIRVDALPQQTYVSAADSSTGGLTITMIDRVDGNGFNCQTIAATIVNEGGQLVAYLNADTKIALGVGLGEEFELLIRWNKDNSAALYVNGVVAGKANDITAVCSYNGTDQPGYIYSGEAANITITDVAVYEDPTAAAVEAFQALIASLDFSAVYSAAELPASVAGAPISWSSSNPAVLSDAGKVVAAPIMDTQVTLTASCAGAEASVVATVKANDYIAPTAVLYAFPAHINTGASSNVDYTTNTGVYVIDSKLIAADQTEATLGGKANTAAIDHIARDLLLKQTIKIDAMPEMSYVSAAESSTGGFNLYIIDRVDGNGADCQTATLTIVNKGGKLYGYLNADTCFDLGVALGEEFEVMLRWNTDNSAAVYVNGMIVGKAANATAVRGWNGTDQIGYRYNDLANGDVKITWTDAAVYENPAAAVAEAFQALIASLDFSAVKGDVVLPAEVSGVAINWTSSNPAVLAADGTFTKPAITTKVTLTATCAGATATVEATVLADAVKLGAAYTTDITAEAAGYYWDAVNVYFVDADRKITAYNLANYGIALTEYFQTVSGNFGGKLVDLTILPANGALLNSFGHHNVQGAPNTFNVNVDKKVFTLSNATNTAEPEVDAKGNATYNRLWSGNNANIDHANDLYLEQTITINALPEKTVEHNGVFVGGSAYANGLSFFMSNRATGSGDCYTFLATIQNEADGALTLYVANANKGSAHGSDMIDLGKQVGDTFTLAVRWDADGSAKIFVDGALVADIADATRVLGYATGTGKYYGFTYANLEGNYDVVIANVNLYEAAPASVAEDTAVSSLADIVGALNLNNVMGNVELPVAFEYAHGAMPIAWTSSNSDVLDASGNIVNHPDVPTQVTLTATAAGQSSSIVATVKPNSFLQPVNAIYAFPGRVHGASSYNFTIAGNVMVYDSANVAEGTTGALLNGVGMPAVIDHSKDMILMQTICIEAMPDAPYTFNYGAGNGLLFNLSDRAQGADGKNLPGGEMLYGSIVNENGKLYLYIGTNDGIDLGMGLGDTFQLSVAWNADDSAQVYVNGKCLASLANATVSKDYSAGDNLTIAYNNVTDTVKFTVSDVAVYEPLAEEVKDALYALTTAEVVASLYAGKVTGNLPATYTVADNAFNVTWAVIDGVVNADGSVIKGAEDKNVTLVATVGGVKLAACQATIAAKSTVAINPTTGVINSYVLNQCDNDKDPYDTVNNSVLSGNFVANGKQFTFAGEAVVGGKTNVAVFQHYNYQMLIQQTLNFKALSENVDVFAYNSENKNYTLNGYRFLVSDRLEAGAEATVDAAVQNVNGQLYLMVATGAKNNNEYVAIALGKALNETFTLSLLWNTDDSLIVYVDGKEVDALADGTRDSSWSGSDCATLNSNDAAANFTVENYAIYNLGNFAMVGDVAYADLQAAIDAAAASTYKVVTLIDNAVVGDIEIPAGVVLDLADYRLTADNVAAFGMIVDSDSSARGSLRVNGNVELNPDNAMMPIYHMENHCYYFFEGSANALGTKGTNSNIKFGFGLNFADSYAYHVMGKNAPEGFDTTCGLTVTVELNWTGNEGDAVVYELSQDLIKKYGNLAFEFAGDMTAAMMLKVTGAEALDYGSEVFVDVTVTSDTGVSMIFDTISYVVAP